MLVENYWRAVPQAYALFMVKLRAPLYWEESFRYTVLFVAWIPKLILLGISEMMWNQQIVRSGWRVLLILYYLWTVMNKIAVSYRCPSSFFVVFCYFLGAFAKLRKATVSFVMSVRPHGTTRLPLDGFSWNLIFEDFSKICREKSNFVKMVSVQIRVYVEVYLSVGVLCCWPLFEYNQVATACYNSQARSVARKSSAFRLTSSKRNNIFHGQLGCPATNNVY